jgi:hypothetical protein
MARRAALWDAPARAAWDLQRALVDVAGDGHLREVEWGPNDRWAPALTGGRGAERLTWTNTWGDEGRNRLEPDRHGLEDTHLFVLGPLGRQGLRVVATKSRAASTGM